MAKKQQKQLFWIIAIVVVIFIFSNGGFLGAAGETCVSNEPTDITDFEEAVLKDVLLTALSKTDNTVTLQDILFFEGSTATSEVKVVCGQEGNTDSCSETEMLLVLDGGDSEGDVDFQFIKNALTSGDFISRTYKGVTYYLDPTATVQNDPNGAYFIEQGTELWISFSAQVNDNIIKGYIDNFYTCTTDTGNGNNGVTPDKDEWISGIPNSVVLIIGAIILFFILIIFLKK